MKHFRPLIWAFAFLVAAHAVATLADASTVVMAVIDGVY